MKVKLLLLIISPFCFAQVGIYGDVYISNNELLAIHTPTTHFIDGIVLSDPLQPGALKFIKTSSSPNNWLDYLEDTLWQTEDPCPEGFRVPTETEWKAERDFWSSNDAAGAFESPLKLPLGDYRHRQTGKLTDPGTSGRYWSSTTKDWTLM